MQEQWRKVRKYDNLKFTYEVSNTGKVRNSDNKRLLKYGIDAFGYTTVQFISNEVNPKSGRYKRKTAKVHRIMAEEFIPNTENKETVNHIDGIKSNNSISNLEWATRHEQLYHAYRLGLKVADRGSSNVNAKLTDNQVIEIRRLYKKGDKNGFGSGKLGKNYGVNETTILNIVNYRTYKNVR